jgi:probable F420-dependent oxidoreductase
MKVGTGIPNILAEVPAAARQAEALGYDEIASSETQHDPFLPLALAAEHTERVGLTTSVAIAFPRSPMIVANMSWDLQLYSKGRFILGLGTQVKGHNERRFSVKWSPPGPRMREYILALRAIWDSWQNGTRLNFEGEHYTFTLMTPFFNPGPIEHPNIPIHIAGVNPFMCRLAGEVADGLRMHGFNTPKYIKEVVLPAVEEGLRRSGRSRKDIEISGGGFIITGKDQAELEKNIQAAKRQISFYGSTRTYMPVFDVHGWSETGMRLHRLSLEGKWDIMPDEITDEMLEEFAVIGTHDDIIPRIKTRFGGIVDRIGFSIPVRTPEDAERLKHMIQELRET